MGKRVLIADDSATIQRAFTMVFGGREDVSLIAARSLDEAISAARQGRPDLVVADVNLAGRTGYELCAAVKADPGLRGVPVYILASNHSPYDDGKGRESGADGHLTKPFESQALIDKVLEVLARPTSIAASAPSVLGATPVVARPAAAPPVSASVARPSAFGGAPTPVHADREDDDDDYGEFRIERSSGASAAPAGVRPAASPAPVAAAARPAPAAPAAGGFGGGLAGGGFGAPPAGASLRPSLIPGARPGPAPARPYAPTSPGSPSVSTLLRRWLRPLGRRPPRSRRHPRPARPRPHRCWPTAPAIRRPSPAAPSWACPRWPSPVSPPVRPTPRSAPLRPRPACPAGPSPPARRR